MPCLSGAQWRTAACSRILTEKKALRISEAISSDLETTTPTERLLCHLSLLAQASGHLPGHLARAAATAPAAFPKGKHAGSLNRESYCS